MPPPPPIPPISQSSNAITFHAFSSTHLIALGVCAAVLLFMIVVKLMHWRGITRSLEITLGGALFAIWPVTTLLHWHLGTLDLNKALPLQFCDIAGFAGGIALWQHRQLACETVYFMGLAGTLQGLITPNLLVDFPDPRFFAFFLLHGGVVVTALYVVTAMRHSPAPGAIARQMKITLSYAAIVGTVNWALDTNYAFLCRKPVQASLMDSLGPWPWYVASLIALAVLFYAILYLPFVILRSLRVQQDE